MALYGASATAKEGTRRFVIDVENAERLAFSTSMT